MKKTWLLTAYGPDRPGLVRAITGVFVGRNCGITDSAMALLGADFVMMIEVELDGETAPENLRVDLENLAASIGMHCSFRPASDKFSETVSEDTPAGQITLYGADRVGIVHKLCAVIQNAGGNIMNMRTERKALFILSVEVSFTENFDENAFEKEIAKLSTELAVRIAWHRALPMIDL